VVRLFRGLTQTELSEKSGIRRPEISAIEAGTRRGTVDTLKALAKALGVPLDVIAGA
jgi:mRNA interferase RelE/StbE